MADDVEYEDFVHGKRSNSFGGPKTTEKHENMEMVRKLIWDCLRTSPISAGTLYHCSISQKYIQPVADPHSRRTD